MVAGEAGYAAALVRVHQVDARAAVVARVAVAVVDVGVAAVAGEAARAAALVADVVGQRAAVAAVGARIRRAVVDRRLALGAGVAGRARALVAVNGVHAGAAVLAGLILARLHGHLAVLAVPPFGAVALVTITVLLRTEMRKKKNAPVLENARLQKQISFRFEAVKSVTNMVTSYWRRGQFFQKLLKKLLVFY